MNLLLDPMRGMARNWRTLLLSFVLACATRYVVQDKLSFERTFSQVPVHIQIPGGYAILGNPVPVVTVRLRGLERDLRSLPSASVEVALELASAGIQDRVVIQNRHVRFPGNFQVGEVNPRELPVVVEAVETRRLPVQPRTRGVPADGVDYELRLDPAVVAVQGAASLVQQLEGISTEEIDVSGLRRSQAREVPLVPPRDAPGVQMVPSQIKVAIQVVDRTEQVEFADIPVRILTPPGTRTDLVVVPPQVKVVLAGRGDVLALVRASDLVVYVDGGEARSTGQVVLPVRGQAPAGISVRAIHPETVSVSIRE